MNDRQPASRWNWLVMGAGAEEAPAPLGTEVAADALPIGRRHLAVGLAVAYPLCIFLGYLLIPSTGGPSPLWAADAVLFMAFLALPTRSWPWIGLLAAAEELVTVPIATEALFGRGMSLTAMLWYALAHVLTPLGPVVVARWLWPARIKPSLAVIASPLWLPAILAGVLPGALLGDWLLSNRNSTALASTEVAIWMLGASLGIVLFAPALAILLGERQRQQDHAPGQAAEAASIVALVILIFLWRGYIPSPALARVPSMMLLIFPMSWLALRFSHRLVCVSVPVIAVAVAYVAVHGLGSFQPLPSLAEWQDPMLSAQLSMLAVFGPTLFISRIVFNQRRLLSSMTRDRARLRWYASELDQAEDAARHRTAADLHDGIAQLLTGQSLLLAALRPHLADAAALKLLAGAEAASTEAQQHVRDIITDLDPAELESTNLADLVVSMGSQFYRRYHFQVIANVPISASASAGLEVPADTLRLVFRVIRELIFNAYKHSQGTRVQIDARCIDGQVIIAVYDDGIGFARAGLPPRAAGHGLGLIQLSERVEAAGGTVTFGSRHGIDSLITVVLPWQLRVPALPESERASVEAQR